MRITKPTRTTTLLAVLSLALGGAAIASAAGVTNADSGPGKAESESQEPANAFGKCVSDAAKAREDGANGSSPALACERPERGDRASERGAERRAFGRCVSQAARRGDANPTEACAELRRGGKSDDGGAGNNGQPDESQTDAAETNGSGSSSESRPNAGLEKPPAQSGRDYGSQVAANASDGRAGGTASESRPNAGLEKPPAQSGRDHGSQVAANASDGRAGGPPADRPTGGGPSR